MKDRATLNKIIDSEHIRQLSRLAPWKSIIVIVTEWLLIGITTVAGFYFNNLLAYCIVWLIVGTRMYALYSLLHDGMHYLLFPNKKTNDWICRFLLAWPLFLSLEKVRKAHFAHHQHLHTENDPEKLHLQYSEFQFPKQPYQLFFVFLADISGFNYLKYNIKKPFIGFFPLFQKNENLVVSLIGLGYYALIFGLVFYLNLGIYFLLYWIIPYITLFQVLNRLRLSTEHFHIPAEKEYQTRTVKLNFWQSVLLSPHNLGFHAEHHLYPSVPFYSLPVLHNLLAQHPDYKQQVLVSKSYISVIKEYTH